MKFTSGIPLAVTVAVSHLCCGLFVKCEGNSIKNKAIQITCGLTSLQDDAPMILFSSHTLFLVVYVKREALQLGTCV